MICWATLGRVFDEASLQQGRSWGRFGRSGKESGWEGEA